MRRSFGWIHVERRRRERLLLLEHGDASHLHAATLPGRHGRCRRRLLEELTFLRIGELSIAIDELEGRSRDVDRVDKAVVLLVCLYIIIPTIIIAIPVD